MLKRTINLVTIAFIIFLISSCNKGFLDTKAIDFRTLKGSYITIEDFQSALNELYYRTRNNFFSSDLQDKFPSLAWQGTEEVYTHKNFGQRTDFGGSILLPSNSDVVYESLWHPAYQIIYDCNIIVQQANSDNNRLTDKQKSKVLAVSRFFRGYMYRMLGVVYGGVPITLKPTTSPKRDYVRASREETYEQSVKDFEFAAENLPDISETGSAKVSNLAAYHELALSYLCLKEWGKAVDAATKVIENSNVALMTQRFGSMVDNEKFGGDVYWDLFRANNQNRSDGNTEAIWVLQYAYDTPGGGDGGFYSCRMLIPRLWQAKIENHDGSVNPLIPLPNDNYWGRGSGFMSPTYYLYHTIWKNDEGDIRNSKYNIVRDMKVDNPASDYDGEWVFKDKIPIRLNNFVDTARNFYPIFAKTATIGQIPKDLYSSDQTVEGSLQSVAASGRTYRGRYVIRLAETYLVRAEAYLGKGEKGLAAQDINEVRNRSNASPVAPSDVDIDYILDERLRELSFEGFRLFTLMRTEKLIERTRKLNPYVGDMYKDYNNLWPIPQEEIDKNVNGNLKQNPGY